MPETHAAPPAITAPSPALIFATLSGFQQTAVLKTALGLDLFTRIVQGADTAAELARQTQCALRGIRILCDSLAVLGLLQKQDEHYHLAPDSAPFLDRNSPAYLGSIADFLTADFQFEAFAKLSDAVRKGGSALPDEPALQPDSPVWVSFARNMGPMQRLTAQVLAELLLPRATDPCKVLDISAGHGQFGIAMAQRNPNAEVYALDWPSVLEVARENAAAAGVADRYHLLPGSAFEVELGADYDWVLLPNFLHHFDPATCEGLLRRVRAALSPEGEVAVLDFIVNDDRITPPNAALFSLTMLATTSAGQAYSYSELEAMFHHAGFADTELHPLPPGFQRAIIATP